MINRGRSAAAARDQAPLRPSGLRPSGKPPAAGATGALVGQPATSRARVVAGKTGTGSAGKDADRVKPKDEPEARGAPKAPADPRDPEGLLAAEFGRISLNSRESVTAEEMHAALFIADWDIEAVFGFFAIIDKDADGRVSLEDWLTFRAAMPQSTAQEQAWIEEVRKRGVGVDLVGKVQTILSKFDEDKDGLLNNRELAKFVRAVNEEEGIIDDHQFGAYVKESLGEHDADGDKGLNAGEFLNFFKAFALKVAGARLHEEKRRVAKELRKKGILPPYEIQSDQSSWQGDDTWVCDVSVHGQVMDAVKCAWNRKKTPLLVDASADDRDDPRPTPLDLIFGGAYRGMDDHMTYEGRFEFLDLKRSVLAVNIKKSNGAFVERDQDWGPVQYDYRKRVIRSMQDGDVLVLQMSTCCPPLKSKLFHPNKFPSELLNSSLADARLLMTKWPGKMIEREDNFLKIEDSWNVLLITKFAPEDYERFLKDEVPLELCQRILVRNGPGS